MSQLIRGLDAVLSNVTTSKTGTVSTQKKKGSVEAHIQNWGARHSCNLPTSEQVSFGNGTKPVPNAVQNPAWPGCGSTQKQIPLPSTERTMETVLSRKGLGPEQTSAVLAGASTAMLNLESGK